MEPELDTHARSACQTLLGHIGLNDGAGATIVFSGADPVVRSRHRYGAATADDARFDPASVAAYAPRPGELLRSETVFGQIDHVAPITRYSETQGYWERMPQPRGASTATW